MAETDLTVGIDVGGTFTDCVLLHADGAITTGKALSTPPDFWHGVLDSVGDAAASCGLTRRAALERARLLVHGTTIAENALLTGAGTRAGLITTRGFEDTLLIARARARWLGLSETEIKRIVKTEKPPPLIPRVLTEGIVERIDADGRVVTPLDLGSAERAIRRLLAAGVRSLAISLLWSFVNPAHEQAVAALAAKLAPELFVTTGAELAPYEGEYERTNTVAMNACLGEIAGRYLATLRRLLEEEGLRAPLLVTQGYGGALRAEVAARNAVGLIESGPASGMVASRYVGAALGCRNIIATDMGGTTFKVGLIADGLLEQGTNPTLARYSVLVPKIHVESIGAGGGSIAWLAEGTGTLQVGPRSAGALPGPACYGRGGSEPTVTDADLVLGYLNPAFFLGGQMRLERAAAERAIEQHIARPLGVSVVEAAAGIYKLACSQSADLIRKVSIERGHDPRAFAVFAYGGAGPVHAGLYAYHLGAAEIVVPFTASVHCAMGAVCADVVREYGASDPMRFPADPARVNANFARLEAQARADLETDGFSGDAVRLRRHLELKFRRQVHSVRIPVPDGALTAADVEALHAQFQSAYERRFGKGAAFQAAGAEIIAFGVEAVGLVPKPTLQRWPARADLPAEALMGHRRAYFVEPGDPLAPPRAVDAPVYRLPGLAAGDRVVGPAIVETPVTTIVVQLGQTAAVDAHLNVRITLEARP